MTHEKYRPEFQEFLENLADEVTTINQFEIDINGEKEIRGVIVIAGQNKKDKKYKQYKIDLRDLGLTDDDFNNLMDTLIKNDSFNANLTALLLSGNCLKNIRKIYLLTGVEELDLSYNTEILTPLLIPSLVHTVYWYGNEKITQEIAYNIRQHDLYHTYAVIFDDAENQSLYKNVKQIDDEDYKELIASFNKKVDSNSNELPNISSKISCSFTIEAMTTPDDAHSNNTSTRSSSAPVAPISPLYNAHSSSRPFYRLDDDELPRKKLSGCLPLSFFNKNKA